jgi:hypothetical protein
MCDDWTMSIAQKIFYHKEISFFDRWISHQDIGSSMDQQIYNKRNYVAKMLSNVGSAALIQNNLRPWFSPWWMKVYKRSYDI